MEPGPEKWCLLLDRLPDACSYCRVITDREGIPVAYAWLHGNQVFAAMTYLSPDLLVGKRAT